jgi:hypothetical protein
LVRSGCRRSSSASIKGSTSTPLILSPPITPEMSVSKSHESVIDTFEKLTPRICAPERSQSRIRAPFSSSVAMNSRIA